ncbi:xylose ABC transporter ATP-binding protein [Calorimonas adulescens]|uniref:Xylose ABC transporter ATP-binding protein n=1 Tax=Calorimonas adulescens TaxID=2606906 RepID=A0A5D8QB88_9THEO|nr:xylose ABC transporter ATP-binding protein [Calorimonas adulescens]TZE81394.1 xylose ABC transporter ATP-binding protein [Calorimonas adulescens]
MSGYILEMKNISKEFSGVRALNNVCLKVKKGEIHALCGENGAGKSTLMKILNGIYPYGSYSGEIIYNGEKLILRSIRDAEKYGIAIIHQELALIKELSVAENIFVGNEPNNSGIINFNEMYDKTLSLLNELGLNINPYTKIKNLGIGQQQMVEIAKALSRKTSLLILDEPTASLTDPEVEILMGILRQLKINGVTCIYISHKLDEIFKIADSVTVLRDGNTVGSAEIEDITEEEIIRMMVGREITDLFFREEHIIGEEILKVMNFNVYDITHINKKIVDSVNFTLRKGEILGIAGLIGAGRTELVSSIFGSYPGRFSGEIYLEGRPVKIQGPVDAMRNGILMVPEDRKRQGLVRSMSVKENITLATLDNYRTLLGKINEVEEIVNTRKYINKLRIKAVDFNFSVNKLSGGNQQKVVLAKTLLADPKILILDEPTRGIDVGAKYEIYRLMFELVKSGISIIMVSSELPEIIGISDRILVMHEGKITGEFVNENVTQEMIMKSAIGGAS